MKWLVLFLLAPVILHAADDAPAWSKPVKGLRARLFFLPSQEPELDKTFDVMIELQEVGIDTSMGLNHNDLTVRFSQEQPDCTVTDAKGQVIAPEGLNGDFLSSIWNLVLPPRGRLSFAIGAGGGKPPGPPRPPGSFLRAGQMGLWIIPPTGGPYHLSGILKVTPSRPEHNVEPYRGWIGELVLPPVEIPAK